MWLGALYAVAAVFTYYIKSGGGSAWSCDVSQLSARDINQKKHQSGMNGVTAGFVDRSQFSSFTPRLKGPGFHQSRGSSPKALCSHTSLSALPTRLSSSPVRRGAVIIGLKSNHASINPRTFDWVSSSDSLWAWCLPQYFYCEP